MIGARRLLTRGTTARLRATLFAASVAASVVACADGPTAAAPPCANPQGGSFTGTAAGTAAGTLAGCSTYAITSSGTSPAMGLVINSGPATSPTHVVNLARSGTRPTIGTYAISINTGQFTGNVFVNPGGRSFGLVSGSVTVTTSETGTLSGSINVTGTETGTGNSITVTGNFTSVCTAGGSVTC